MNNADVENEEGNTESNKAVLVDGDTNEKLKQVPVTVSCFDASSTCSGSDKVLNSMQTRANDMFRLKFLMAQLREKQLREELELEARELENKRKLMKIMNEVEIARLEMKFKEECSLEDLSDHSEMADNRVCNTKAMLKGNTADFNTQICQPSMETSFKKVMTGLELPKIELTTFSGDPTEFWKFTRQFDIYVADKLNDDGQRLLYLLHYCTGQARRAIEECIMLPPDEGYGRARRILKELFGRPHLVARSLIDNLFSGPIMLPNTADALTSFAIKLQNCEIALRQMNLLCDLNSLDTLERLVRKLPKDLQFRWAEHVDKIYELGREPTFSELTEFVASKARIAGNRFGMLCRGESTRISDLKESTRSQMNPSRIVKPNMSSFVLHNATKFLKEQLCSYCKGDHLLEKCTEFQVLDVQNRWKHIRGIKACFMCMEMKHRALQCRSKRCGYDGCTARHHRLLHYANMPNDKQLANVNRISNCSRDNTANDVRLGVIPVRIDGPKGSIETYALLDNGSNTTLIKENLLELLGLDYTVSDIELNTINSSVSMNCRRCRVKIASLDGSECIEVERAFSVRELPITIPSYQNGNIINDWPHLKEIQFNKLNGGQVSMLIGCDVPEAHWVLDQRLGSRKQPFAIRTLLGWVLLGPLGMANANGTSVNYMNCGESAIIEQLKTLYNSDFYDTDKLQRSNSINDSEALTLVTSSTRICNGHFEIGLPWKVEPRILSNNYELAVKRLGFLRKRLLKDSKLFSEYTKILSSHLEKGYIVKVPIEQMIPSNRPKWYLPHHPVLNPKKPNKIRIVFDFAAKFKGLSLNDCLHQGPDITANLVGVLMRFRSDVIAMSADIEEMFLQVRVPLHDRNALRFLWWNGNDINGEIEELQLTVHPFGATSSPFCCSFALRKTVEEFGGSCDDAVQNAIRLNFYVDDCLISLPSIEDATQFVQQIRDILQKGGFRLRKWISNARELLEVIPDSERDNAIVEIGSDKLNTGRTLGLEWNTELDVLCFKFSFSKVVLTRREMLSCLCSIFDPLGLVGPILLPGKCLLQDLCRKGLNWDDPVGEREREIWERWMTNMNKLGELSIPRCTKPMSNVQPLATDLHIFCDACETGYGAVAYIRYTYDRDVFQCRILFAKSRVAPLKTVTIPRLELTAATLSVRIYQIIKNELLINFNQVYFWTDSMIVLHYISNVSSRFSIFVANRLAVIHEHTSVNQWKHVRSGQNPADYASRGVDCNEDRLNTWLNGPRFLQQPKEQWPESAIQSIDEQTIEYKKLSINIISTNDDIKHSPLLSQFSDWFKLLKSAAWLTRFKVYIIAKHGKNRDAVIAKGHLTLKEIKLARLDVIRLVQNEAFQSEIYSVGERVMKKDEIYRNFKTGPLKQLCPVIINGILRVGGRLEFSHYSTDFKHPIILPTSHNVTQSLIRYYHKLEGHSGVSHVLTSLRQTYWILHGRSAVKRVLSRCLVCRKVQGRLGEQMMAPLPPFRTETGWFPFQYVGVDYFGPFLVKKGRGHEKRYGCIFTCLQCRAVHLEIAHSLTTDSFIMALTRFISRRGRPEELYSDNGTNFRGADAELRKHIKEWSQDKINEKLLSYGIQWHFNPPHSSHRGGAWERLIRSTRRILSSILNNQTVHDEVLQTYITEVERIINDRPLIPVCDDTEQLEVLRPNNLIMLRSNDGPFPECSAEVLYRNRWKQVNYLASVFWRRWMKEYVPMLQTRQKWLNKRRNFRQGDIVLVSSETTPKGRWPMAVITECSTDTDGLVRTVTLRTANGILKRDIRKLCLLEGVGEPEQV